MTIGQHGPDSGKDALLQYHRREMEGRSSAPPSRPMTRPLVTLLMTTYKHEPFVHQAVRSALAQDYQPLQIIISDDASPDRTFEAIVEETRGYRGPHELHVRRNAERRRSIRHVEEAMSLVRGELVVTAHGDDVSVPRRVSMLVEAWRRERVSMVSSGLLIIDRDGSRHMPVNEAAPARRIPPEEIVAEGWLWQMLGATLAMEPDVIRGFAPLGDRLPIGLDFVLPLRAAAMKGLYYVKEPLVLYRRHGGNMSNFTTDRANRSRAAFEETSAALQVLMHMQWYDDIGVLQAARPDDTALVRLRGQLLDRLHQDLRSWSRYRAALWAEGKLPTWIDEAEMMARPLIFPQPADQAFAAHSADPGQATSAQDSAPAPTQNTG